WVNVASLRRATIPGSRNAAAAIDVSARIRCPPPCKRGAIAVIFSPLSLCLSMHHTEVAVIGGGIVGLATAHALTRRHPRLRVSVVEKEARLAAHQTGHNSGVLHSGIYYRPDSLKARNCRDGKEAMEEF